MSPKEFSITLENPVSGFYRPGDTLGGKVLITLAKKNSFKTLRIILLGEARVSWYEKEDAGPFLVEASEEYLHFEAEINIEELKPLVRAEYGFEYVLAEGLPSSFSSPYGNIIYVIKAILEGKKDPEVVCQEFVINGPIDLNEIPDSSEPIKMDFSQSLLFENGNLEMEVKLRKSGFVAGERIGFRCRFSNPSEEDVMTNSYLLKEIVYFVKDKKECVSEILMSHEGPKLKPHEVKEWNSELEIPLSWFSSLQNCNIIQMHIYLSIEMEIPVPNINLERKIPLIIGTVPLKEEDVLVMENSELNVEFAKLLPANSSGTDEVNEKKKSRAMRQKRAMTTCLVFRPAKPRLKLPEPKPESWAKPKGKNQVSTELPQQELSTNRVLDAELSKISPLTSEIDGTGRPKWPEHYIRRKDPSGSAPPQDEVLEFTKSTQILAQLEQPPPKPARLKKCKPILPVPLKIEGTKTETDFAMITSDLDKNLPYPTTIPQNFPQPDFSFNMRVDGHKAPPPIGWNVRQNTLTLRRGRCGLGKK